MGTPGRTWKQRTKFMPCKYCDKPIEVGIKTRKMPHHIECGIKASVQSITEMHDRTGATYEKWRAGMRAWIERDSRTPPPPITK